MTLSFRIANKPLTTKHHGCNLFAGLELLDGEEHEDERRILECAPNRPLVVMSWITEAWVQRQHEKTLMPGAKVGDPPVQKYSGIRVSPPILARTFQHMSEARSRSTTNGLSLSLSLTQSSLIGGDAGVQPIA